MCIRDSYSTDGYTRSIMATVREEQSKRRKQQESEREVVVDLSLIHICS